MLCFKQPKSRPESIAEAEVCPHGEPPLEAVSLKARGAELRTLFADAGVQPFLVDREFMVINMDCIAEQRNVHRLKASSASPVPAIGDGMGVEGMHQTKNCLGGRRANLAARTLALRNGMRGRGFVRVESQRDRNSVSGTMEIIQPTVRSHLVEPVTEHHLQQGHDHADPPTPSSKSGRGLNWTASRRALAVLVVREEHLSRTDKGLQSLSDDRRLAERLQRLNLDMVIMAGDGNCQFRTLAHELYGSQEYHPQVREKVIRHIRSNQDEFECFLGEDFDAYVSCMSRACTWGDELTLRAACDAYGVIIFVVTSEAQNWFLTYEPKEVNDEAGEIFLTYVSPIHYNAIKRKASLRILSKQLSSSFKRLANSGNFGNISGNLVHGSVPVSVPLSSTSDPRHSY